MDLNIDDSGPNPSLYPPSGLGGAAAFSEAGEEIQVESGKPSAPDYRDDRFAPDDLVTNHPPAPPVPAGEDQGFQSPPAPEGLDEEPFSVGSTGADVRRFQQRMADRRGQELPYPSKPFSESDKAAVEVLQEAAGLEVTGEVDSETWAAAWTHPLVHVG